MKLSAQRCYEQNFLSQMAVILFRFDKSATEVNNQIQNLFKILGYDINPWVVLVLKVRVYILRLFSLQYSDVVN